MNSAVKIQKQDAIIAFFNIFSDKLRLQECKDTSEVEYLLHSVVKFIQCGCLQYYDHSNFDFSDTVDFLRQQLQPCFYNALDPKAAEQGDDIERVKILAALLYVFRLLRTDIFEEWVKLLSLENVSQITEIMEYFDSPEIWTSPNAWLEILWTASINVSGYASSPADSPSYAASASVAFVDSMNSFGGLSTPASKKMHIYKFSPMSEVLKSPRCSAVKINQRRRSGGQPKASHAMKINHLQKCLAEKQNQLKSTGDELDAFQVRCQTLEKENTILLDQNNRLEKKVTEWRARTKEFDILQKQITELMQREAALTDRNNSLLAERDSSIALKRQLSVDRDDVFKQLDLAKEEISELHQALTKLKHDFCNEISNHRETRKKYLKLVDDSMVGEAKWRRTVIELEQDRSNAKRNLQRLQERLDEKNKLEEEIKMKTIEISRLQLENKVLIDAEKQRKSSRASVSQSIKQVPRIPKPRFSTLKEQRATKSRVKIEGTQREVDVKPKIGTTDFISFSSDTSSMRSKEVHKNATKYAKQTEEERLHQLKERNKKQPPHLQESYMPEINSMSKDARVIEESKGRSPFRHFNCFSSSRKR